MTFVARTGACAALFVSAILSGAQAQTIRWDHYDVPHIYGPDIPTVVRGLGYAQMKLHAEALLNNVAHARGRYAEYLGDAPGKFNSTYDERVRTFGITARAEAWAKSGGADQTAILQAFCDGVNEYAAHHPGDILPDLKNILPVYPTDVVAGELNTIFYTFLLEQDGVQALIDTWKSGGAAAANSLRAVAPRDGSNGWALGPSKTVNKDTILMGNPHLPWGISQPISNYQADENFGVYQWVEANLVVGNPKAPALNAQGVTFIGAPFIGIGFSDKVGWTHTNNTILNADLFELTLDSTGTKYKYGNTYLPLAHSTDEVKIKQPDGSLITHTIDIYASIPGPVVAFNSTHTKALALRVPLGAGDQLVKQYWNMIRAQNIEEFKVAESALQMPFFNTMAADSSGNIFYLFGGQQPVRAPGTSFIQYHAVQDGSNPANLWTKTYSFDQLPQATNPPGGFVANSNQPPWFSAFPQPESLNQANYQPYVSPVFMEFRPQHGALLLTYGQQPRTAADILNAKMSNEMLLSDRVLPDLLSFAAGSSDPNVQAAIKILNNWDHTADADSVGGTLFEVWWNQVVNDVNAGAISADTSDSLYYTHPAFRVPFDPANPLTTPSGLDPANAAKLVADLGTAYSSAQSMYHANGGAAVAWGDAHHATLVTRAGPRERLVETKGPTFPFLGNDRLSGADDEFGPIRVVNPNNVTVPLLGYALTYGGDGYVQVIEFTPNGAEGGTLLTYGNASRPNSKHITDQLPLFDTFSLKPALRTLAAVEAATVSVEGF
jgi:acyl-homoserine-lactone acylase